jgi:thioredoxin-like negative regulator of GroEL
MTKSAIRIIVVLILFSGGQIIAGDSGAIDWLTNQRTAFQEAAESERPIVVDLWAVWCAPCKVMEETTFADAGVVEMIAGFVPLKLNIDAENIFVDYHRIESFPTTLFLDHEEREIARLMGLVEADRFLQAMKDVLEGYPAYLEAVERENDAEALDAVASYLLQNGNLERTETLLRRVVKLSKADRSRREDYTLRLAEVWLAQERTGAAAKEFSRLSTEAESLDLQGRALVDLVRAERQRGRDSEAERALSRLREEFPELSKQFD